MKLLLTSTGLENPNLLRLFRLLLPCAPEDARALFIPTAAIFCDAVEMLPECLEDLYRAGLARSNIAISDLHTPLTAEFLSGFDCIYLAGGDTKHLAHRIAEGSHTALLSYLDASSGVILGASAGAMVFSAHEAARLDVLPNELHVHCASGSPDEALPPASAPIFLTNRQGILFTGGHEARILS